MIERLLTRLFKLEEINGAGRCPTYLFRWTLYQPKWGHGFGVYVHKFVGDDWSLDLHDHPKRFISIGLKGRYCEQTIVGGFVPVARTYRAPWVRTFPAHHRHRISLLPDRRPCWTLVIVLTHQREWGFWHMGTFIHWKEYVRSKTADVMKACP